MSVTPNYKFSSKTQTKGPERVNYMRVIAHGDKLDDLEKIIKQHLTVTSMEDIPEMYGRSVQYSGTMQGTVYKVYLECGACPTADGGQGHTVEIRCPLTEKDELSPFVAKEMRRYEAEMTAEIRRIDRVLR